MNENDYCATVSNACVFGAHHENLNEDRPKLSAAQMYTVTLVSGNVRFMWIFAGVPWREGLRDIGVIEKVDFQGFRALHLRNLRNKANVII